MRILVTGGAGYIGSHTCVELLKEGHEVIIIDNFINSTPEILESIREITNKKFKFYNADLNDEKATEKAFIENDIDAVIHFAGLKSVSESVKMPLAYYNNNINSTLKLCELMNKYDVKKLVFSSSATVYGENSKVPFKEELPMTTTNPYGRTKIMIENILQDIYASDDEWGIVILRYFNPIGAHESGLIGEEPNGIPNNLLPYICKVATKELKYLNIFGNDYDTIDGTGVRDYIHVVDIAKGHIKALESIRSKTGIDVYNLGTGKGYSVLEVVNIFEKVTGCKIKYQIISRRPGDIAICYADATKANKILEWKAEKDIYDMCRDTWNFIKNKNEIIYKLRRAK